MPTTKPMELIWIKLDDAEVSELNVRKEDREEEIEQLAKSIDEIDLQQPVVAYKDKNKYKVIIGQRRLLAFKRLNRPSIPAIIVDVKDKYDAVVRSFSENIQRRDISYREKMDAATTLYAHYNSMDKVANLLGVTTQTVRSYLGYSAVPEEIKKMVDKGELSAKTAVRITQQIEDKSKAVEIAREVQEFPNNYQRRLMVDLAKKNPNKAPREIKKLVKQMGKPVVVHFSSEIKERLERASALISLEEEDIIELAVQEWLDRNQIK